MKKTLLINKNDVVLSNADDTESNIISFSLIKQYQQLGIWGMIDYKHNSKIKTVFEFGKAYHTIIMGQKNDVVILPNEDGFNSVETEIATDWIVNYNKMNGENRDRCFITQKEYDIIQEMQNVVYHCPLLTDVLKSNKTTYEVESDIEYNGWGIKGRYDMKCGNIIFDWKTFSKVPTLENMNFTTKGYAIQATMYKMIFGCNDFVFIYQMKEPPYTIGIIGCTTDFFKLGQWQLDILLNRLDNELKSGQATPHSYLLNLQVAHTEVKQWDYKI